MDSWTASVRGETAAEAMEQALLARYGPQILDAPGLDETTAARIRAAMTGLGWVRDDGGTWVKVREASHGRRV